MDKNRNTRKKQDNLIRDVANIHHCSMRTVQRAVSREKGYNQDVLDTYNRLKEAYEASKSIVAKRVSPNNNSPYPKA